jgi:hypothetical protein
MSNSVTEPDELQARSEAMLALARTYQRRATELVSCICSVLRNTDDHSDPLFMLAQIIALDQLRSEALGVAPGCWQESMQRQRVMQQNVIDMLKRKFRMEALN